MTLAQSVDPFHCKDIEIALTEIEAMATQITKLIDETNERTNIIQNLIRKFILGFFTIHHKAWIMERKRRSGFRWFLTVAFYKLF